MEFIPPSEIDGFSFLEPVCADPCLNVWNGVSNETSEPVIIQIFNKNRLTQHNGFSMLASQVELMNNLKHPLLAKVHGIVEDAKYFYYILEAPQGITLKSKIEEDGKVSEEKAKTFILSLIDFYQSISAELPRYNVSMTTQSVIVNDQFQIIQIYPSFHDKEMRINNELLSCCFSAPESLTEGDKYHPNSDTWACGVFLYFITIGTMPFQADTVAGIQDRILTTRPIFPMIISPDLRLLLGKMLTKNPMMRLSLEDVHTQSWIVENHVSSIKRRNSIECFDLVTNSKHSIPKPRRKTSSGEREIILEEASKNLKGSKHNFIQCNTSVRLTPRKQFVGIARVASNSKFVPLKK